jgi:hypothetical protein
MRRFAAAVVRRREKAKGHFPARGHAKPTDSLVIPFRRAIGLSPAPNKM